MIDSVREKIEQMVTDQLIPRGINNQKVLEAMRKVPRHKFIDSDKLPRAYTDSPLPIDEGQTISQPYMVALMTQCLDLKGTEKILEIGTGSGYQTAVLSELSVGVYSVERYAGLADQAKKKLMELGYSNISITTGDGTLGWSQEAPYDGIIVTAGAPQIPEALLDQLKESGRMVIPVGNKISQTLKVIEKKDDQIFKKDICVCVFVPLVGQQAWEE
ncbi:MAG: protein-L-isoaspartate(D-aspartate) O-methyltransferase [Candidatus Omnitrophica bacterium]|nr:protein-L-isoaspartate(D-aspartate) O-methyltransferase [Candidatus Omnitrophota bacterium]